MLGVGLLMGVSTVGSGIGLWIVGQAAVGAWKKCYAAGKPAPMLLLVFVAMPLSQTFYGFILMNQMLSRVVDAAGNVIMLVPEKAMLYFAVGIAAAASNVITAITQGKIAAAACDAQAETGRGFAQYIAVIGIAESIALFAMVFSMIAL
jgi:V/A-type H+-transporting ATPase subunit K